MDYLAAPVLSMVNPDTNKGKTRIWYLKDLLRRTEGMDRYFYRNNSSDVLPKLESGKPVTYAAYRWACKNLQNVLDARAEKEMRQRNVRTGKLSPAQPRGQAQIDLRTRIQQVRERDNARKLKNRLSEIRKYVNDTNVNIDDDSYLKDLYALADFSDRDLFGAFSLAIMYGQAQGYQLARG